VDGTSVHWEALHTFNPAAILRFGRIYVLYRAEDDRGAMRIGMHTSRLGLAESDDPHIVESEDGTYVLTYTQWNRSKTDAAIATSKDLIHWVKYGPALGTQGKYAALSYKSAGIVTQVRGGRLIAARIGGRYWMYWGEGIIRLAVSDDPIHWKPIVDEHDEPVTVLGKRGGRFDSSFPETGPPPLLTAKGIVVLYNGKNALDGGDPDLGPNAYSAGEALFRADAPAKLIARGPTRA
jgi:beta-1,2-mannosidase